MNPFGIPRPPAGRGPGPRNRWLRRIAAATGLALVPGLLTPVAFAEDIEPLGRPHLQAPHATKVRPFTAQVNKKAAAEVRKAADADRLAAARARHDQQRKVTWPKAGKASVSVPLEGSHQAKPGSLPVTVAAPGKGKTAESLAVEVLDQKAAAKLGVKGVVLKLTGPDGGGKARLGIDYSAFASAYGGDWAGRLQLMRLPGCALKDPSAAKCRKRIEVDSVNNREKDSIAAPVSFASGGQTMMLALAAGAKSGAGTYKATPLSSSSTWEAGGSSGSFTWSYPLRVPPSAAGPKPDLSISYDSGAVDGQTANSNNQGSQVGTGFDITSSYIERKYGSCDDDGQDGKYDLCWKYENASLVLNGKATELVLDDTTGVWRLKDDDASTVTHSTGADNGDDGTTGIDGQGEYWTVVTGDGTKYVFGLNKLDGAADSDRTNSVWTVPVFGDDPVEPGFTSGDTFADRAKMQAWRWNLDYVEDTHGNAMSYWYAAEHNNYDKLGDDNTGTDYTRGGYLKEIRYGQRSDALFSGSPAASDKVVFDYAERCLASGTGCDSLTKDTRDNWPDVPFDAICKDGDKCTGNVGPTFFTRKRLTAITTYAWNAAAATPAFEPVDVWSLKQLYLDPGDTGDSTDQSLWLDEIKHTGKRGTDLSLDPVKFSHVMLPNRVDGTDNILPLDKPRLKTVTSETGAQTIVTYLDADCTAAGTKPKVDENTKRCYPVYWSPNGEKDPILDWFQKYPVYAVSTTDPFGGSEAVQHSYQYTGGGAWHYDENPLTPAKERTWSIWRGYQQVTHITGVSGHTQSKEVTVYLRGMNGDRVLGTDGKTPDPDKRKTVEATGIKADKITDSEQYAGFTRESVTYDSDTEVGATVNDPWSKRTATQHKSYADTEAYYLRTAATHTRTNITSKLTPYDRLHTVKTAYDDYGMAETVEDEGDDSVTGDEKCTRTWYARNTGKGINSLVSRTRTVAATCATTDGSLDLPADSKRAGDVISDTATVYDNTAATTWTAAQTPTKGDANWTGRAKGYGSDDAPAWQKGSTTTYDTLGRPRIVKDTNGATVSDTTYVPVAAGPLTSTAVADAKTYTTTTALDFATGATLKVTDPNNKVTQSEYDSLGRITKLWLPNRNKVLGKTPNYVYTYNVTNADMSWVSTATLKNDGSGYNTSYEFYDSLLRSRQTQAPTPQGGRLISLTLYDARGLAVSQQGDIWDSTSLPSAKAAEISGGQAPIQTDTTYDGAGRATKAVTKVHGATRWTTDTTYTGDTVATTAPAGGQATAVVTNALGQTTERREYAGPTPTGTDFTTTDYTYTPAGQQETVTGPDQTKWSNTYDLFGRQVTATDPDKGKTSSEYNDLDQLVSTTPNDDASKKLLYEYDELGRKKGMWQVDKTDANKLAAWGFDTVAKGQQDTATRYDGGVGGKAYTQKVTAFDSMYHVTGSQLVLPDTESLVSDGYIPNKPLSFSTGYNLDGTISQYSAPAVGGLAAETVSYTYNALGGQLTATGTTGYLQGAAFSPQGDLRQLTLGKDGASSAKKAYLNWDYEEGTRRLTRSFVTDDVHGYMPQELKFTQDDAGNVTSIFDATTQGGTAKADYQCFAYDGNRRMTEAWTPKTADCATAGRTVANLDGAAPYWTSYTYTGAGQRKTETQHTTSGDKTTTYTYNDPADTKPHTLDKTTGARAGTYTYDKSGNALTRPGPTAQQSLAWNTEGDLSKLTESTKETNYLYDAGGELLIRRAKGDGDTILYLGAGTELRLTTKGTTKTASGTRYYTANGQTIAVRTATSGFSGTKLSFLAADHHGTSSIALDATTYAVTKRYSTPFGAPRGTKPTSWPDDKAFLGKPTDDTTGLTHVGAREYDPTIGQFISVDPLLELDKHQTLNGYSYGAQNPTTQSDPSGMGLACGGAGGQQEGCPDRPDGTKGNGRMVEGSDYHKSHKSHPCNSSCGTAQAGSGNSGGGSPLGWLGDVAGAVVDEAINTGSSYLQGSYQQYLTEKGCVLHGEDCEDVAGFLLATNPTTAGDMGLTSRGAEISGDYANGDSAQGTGKLLFDLALLLGTRGEGGVAAEADAIKLRALRCSFTPATPVLVAHGKTKPISEIKTGDEVEAADPANGKHKGLRKVTATLINHDYDLVDLRIQHPDGSVTTLHTTAEHPFWDDTLHTWVPAGELRTGHNLNTASDHHVRVAAVIPRHGDRDMYNLTVDDLHTYYVLAGATPILVHNVCPKLGNYDGAGGTGYGPADDATRVSGPWTKNDIGRGTRGLRPNQVGDRLQIHHADQMPGSPIHELDQDFHLNADIHRNRFNQGVDKLMRRQDTQMHWWYRSMEQGWGSAYGPEAWFDNWPK
ncbi:polymorphic toxin-type HINT domain-containing protein [Streptomyces diastatochromogenes]|uniref:polymorphic toxin-type HINT domain-containing protein n=1 Tax=Streptomyces diastatochromogenes TaxID=42236 RepID=UPI001ABF04D9|nr:polymorphic toxin-type HINT domain-containing protein [Streptomyces diastatochromogenes]MCZ0991799.1 polymorphic toxin-type HINT domain-containing protein [Streptomyces diastatochromogenes]